MKAALTVNPSDPAVRKELGFAGYGPRNPVPKGLYDQPLEIADMRKSQQLQLNLKLRTADGTPFERVMYLTVPVLTTP